MPYLPWCTYIFRSGWTRAGGRQDEAKRRGSIIAKIRTEERKRKDGGTSAPANGHETRSRRALVPVVLLLDVCDDVRLKSALGAVVQVGKRLAVIQ